MCSTNGEEVGFQGSKWVNREIARARRAKTKGLGLGPRKAKN